MKVVELTRQGALSDWARKAQKGPVLLTNGGRPVAAVVSVVGLAWDDLVVGSAPDFLSLIERSRRRCKAGTGIPLEESRRPKGLSPMQTRKRAARTHR